MIIVLVTLQHSVEYIKGMYMTWFKTLIVMSVRKRIVFKLA